MITRLGGKWLWLSALGVICTVIYLLSTVTGKLPGPDFYMRDKLLHILAYGAVAFIGFQAFSHWLNVRQAAALALGYALIYGCSDELHQLFVRGRSADLADLCADALGAALVLGFVLWYPARRKSPAAAHATLDETVTA